MPNTLDSSVFLLRIFAYLYVLEMKKRHEIDSNNSTIKQRIFLNITYTQIYNIKITKFIKNFDY